MSCVVHGRVVEAAEAGQAVEFIGPVPGAARLTELVAKGINKGMIGKLVKAPTALKATVEFSNGVTVDVDLEKLALSSFVKVPSREDEFQEVYHGSTARRGILVSFKSANAGNCVVRWHGGDDGEASALELLTPEDKCFRDIGADHTSELKSEDLITAAPTLKKYFLISRQRPAVAAGEDSARVEDVDGTEESGGP